MPKLVSMKVTAEERKARSEPSSMVGEQDQYPYGLQVRLDNDSLEKLGEELPEVGETYVLIAKVKVTATSSHDTAGGGKNRSCELQITSMCLEEASDGKAAADKLYGG